MLDVVVSTTKLFWYMSVVFGIVRNLSYIVEKKEERKKNPHIMRPGTKPKANIKSMFMAQAATSGKRKPEVFYKI